MRRVYGTAFISLDGVIQAPGGPEEDPDGFEFGGWAFPYSEETADGALMQALGDGYDLLLGRRTYDIFAGFWPDVGDDNPIARAFNSCTKYVATSGDDASLTWQNSVALRGDVAGKIAELKRGDGPDLLVQGSSVLYQTLLRHELLDELTLLIYPVVLGAGKRLFAADAAPASFQLVSSTTSPRGVFVGTYRRAGEIETGSFADEFEERSG
jgi:dihydrofolate reductase